MYDSKDQDLKSKASHHVLTCVRRILVAGIGNITSTAVGSILNCLPVDLSGLTPLQVLHSSELSNDDLQDVHLRSVLAARDSYTLSLCLALLALLPHIDHDLCSSLLAPVYHRDSTLSAMHLCGSHFSLQCTCQALRCPSLGGTLSAFHAGLTMLSWIRQRWTSCLDPCLL
jgi:hypothetical protein